MKTKGFKDIELSRLGMGNMRLPMENPGSPSSKIDWGKAHEIIDYAYENGINYFDTAYVYNNGESEKCLGACMKKHPRESFYLATKFNYRANPDYKAVFEEQLERLQTDYIDFYLIHCLMDSNIDDYLNCGCIDYFLEKQKEGKIKYLGFSSHASVATLEKFANHHAWDFAQLQINYFDWNYANTAKEYKVLEERNIPIMVMEPVRGGRLAALNPEAEAVLKSCQPDWSIASWALRFASSLPQVQVVLSGMSTMEQVVDNVNSFNSFEPLTEQQQQVLQNACELFHKNLVVPCTACRYCTEDCPMQINIPEYLSLYNKYKVMGRVSKEELEAVDSVGKPADCIGCGGCTGHCPQNIDTPSIMPKLAELMK